MHKRRSRAFSLWSATALLAFFCVACGNDGGSQPDAGPGGPGGPGDPGAPDGGPGTPDDGGPGASDAGPGGPGAPDAGPGTPDAGPGGPGAPDASPGTPDAGLGGPGTPDAGSGTPDADPGTPDAGPGTPDAAIGDGVAPTVTVAFPPENAWSGNSVITVRGQAVDSDGIAAIRIGGVDATTDDGFANWQAEVPLSVYGPNALVVESEDLGGATDSRAAELTVAHHPLLLTAVGAAFDAPRNRVLLPDLQLNAVLAVDVESGFRSTVSGPGVGTGPEFQEIGNIALHAAENAAYVLDRARAAVVAIDIIAGNRTIIADGASGEPSLGRPTALALDRSGDRVLVVNDEGTLLALDLTTGNRTIISSTERDNGPALSNVQTLAFDAARERALALVSAENGTTLLGVDFDTGDRSILSDNLIGSGPNPDLVNGAMAIDAARDRVLVGGSDFDAIGPDGHISDGLFAIDLETAERTLLSGPGPDAGNGPPFDISIAIAADDTANRAFVFSTNQLDALTSVDLESGDRTIVTASRLGIGPRIDQLIDIAFDSERGRAFVVQNAASAISLGPPALYEIDLSTGARALRSGDGIGDGPDLDTPVSVAVVPGEDRVLVVDFELQALLSIAPDTGLRDIISGPGIGGGAVPSSRSLVFDADRTRALMIDPDTPAIIAVDMDSGAHSILSDQDNGSGDLFISPGGLVLDPVRNRVIVVENREDAQVIAVHLESGDRELLAGPSKGSGPALSLTGSSAALDATRERLYVDGQTSALIEIDLRTGDRVRYDEPFRGLGFPHRGLFFESERGYLWGSAIVFTLVVMDPITREVFLVSH